MARNSLPVKAGTLTNMVGLSGGVAMSHQFVVSVDHGEYDLGAWTKASGLSVSWTACQYRSGESNDSLIFPGNIKYSNIKLARAACSDSAKVQEWLVKTTKDHTPLSGVIRLVDYLYKPVVSWQLKEFYPVGWNITDLDAGTSRPAIETLELAHTGFLNDEVKGGIMGKPGF